MNDSHLPNIEVAPNNNLFKNLPDVFTILKYMLFGGILFVAFLAFYGNLKFLRFLYVFGNSMLIAGAFYGAGGLTGFLFGIPKILQSSHVVSPDQEGNSGEVVHNDNLVQISDWLTKIIVGVGLTQLYEIPGFLYRIGEKFGTSILGYDPKDNLGTNVSVAIILYFSILGFLMVYIWTRIYFVMVLNQTTKNLKNLKIELQTKNDTIDTIQNEKTAVENLLQDTLVAKNEIEEQKLVTQSELDAIITTFPDVTQNLKEKQIEMKKNKDFEDDPHKGKFGGLSEVNGRKISAKVTATSYDTDLFNVDLEVTSTDESKPLAGPVTFYLHPSFPNNIETIPAVNGKVENKLISYGAFTVGVLCDDGETKLELDLSLLDDIPALFKER